jgi:tetratricopeptide (TPR) repeat protein
VRTILLLASLWTSIAWADGRERSRQAFDEAEHRYSLGDFEAALLLFREAYDATPHPDLLFNIAQCHRNLGRTTQATFFFERYLQEQPDAPEAAGIRVLLKELRQAPVVTASVATATVATATRAAPVPAFIALETIEPTPLVEEWWFWTLIAAGVAIVAGGAAFAVHAAQPDPAQPLATFDYR